ncbi:MAG: carbohydrate deacetylase [Planctomycetota bacterium]|jgi:predicted glycoside hydrolase/deacetylase ChbG (UPF0249 family)
MEDRSGKKYVIVNADDFGFSPGINAGILRARREGIVTSTTLTANMPAAAAAVGALADAPELGVGVHLNASQGPPLSGGESALIGEDGQMSFSAAGLIWACFRRPALLDAVEAEFDAQIRWVLDHGIRPTHLDTHRHSHGYGPVFARVIELAKRYNIPFVRRHREKLPRRHWPAASAGQTRTKRVLNVLGRRQVKLGRELLPTVGTWGIAHTGRITSQWLMLAAERAPAGVLEIMTHPGEADDMPTGQSRLGRARRAELTALCDPAVRGAFRQAGVELIHYGHPGIA